jgi:hypothetical protein
MWVDVEAIQCSYRRKADVAVIHAACVCYFAYIDTCMIIINLSQLPTYVCILAFNDVS